MTNAVKSAELREKLLEAGDQLRELRLKPADQRSDSWRGSITEAVTTIQALDGELTALDRAEVRTDGPAAATATPGEAEHRSAGTKFVESEQYAKRQNHRTEDVEVRTLLTSGTSDPGAGLWLPKAQPITPPVTTAMQLVVRDLLPVTQTTMSSVPYIRVLNAAANEFGATAVAEGAAKPEVTHQFESDDAPVRKIAAWIPVTDEIVEDAPALKGFIDTQLVADLRVREQQQLLNGTGTSPQIKGIRQFSGKQTQSAVASDNPATLGRAVGKIENVGGQVTGIVMNPTDYWVMITTRYANQLDNGFGAGAPFNAPSQQMWGAVVVRTNAIESGKALVGDFARGALVFDRATATVKTADQHDDYFIYNKLVVLAEERLALAVLRPDYFCEATL